VNLAIVKNHLIELLAKEDQVSLLAIADPIELVMDEVLSEPGRQVEHVYFPTDGSISMVALIDGHPGLEVAMIGSEGMLGAHLSLGVTSASLHTQVRHGGASWRIGVTSFCAELALSRTLQHGLHRYLHVLFKQQARSVACLHYHLIGPRMARWLLMSQDRAHSDSFYVTHEFLARMLGVRRTGITEAAVALQRSGLIDYHRGNLTILNRVGLEAVACSCYAADQANYAELY
jgi:CRP-like cAMP-binding protein